MSDVTIARPGPPPPPPGYVAPGYERAAQVILGGRDGAVVYVPIVTADVYCGEEVLYRTDAVQTFHKNAGWWRWCVWRRDTDDVPVVTSPEAVWQTNPEAWLHPPWNPPA